MAMLGDVRVGSGWGASGTGVDVRVGSGGGVDRHGTVIGAVLHSCCVLQGTGGPGAPHLPGHHQKLPDKTMWP
eukprot:5429742-Prorocentrum_lima.AAC.1